MKIMAVTITNRYAPLEVRQRLSFTKRRQTEILRDICTDIAEEAVIVSTCNRVEFYFYSDKCAEKLIGYVSELAGGGIEEYLAVYEGDAAAEHLFRITPGLESMVVGEDQILGQVKEAAELAWENGCTGACFNTLFRLAVTAAKRIKTETRLSEIPVSVATIAVHACINELGTLNGKKVLLVGASGQLGSIILKDIKAVSDAVIYATSRRNQNGEDICGAVTVDYNRRYEYINCADCIISATSSPHCIFSADKLERAIMTDKKRVFIDLAVPPDIERYGIYYGIDDLGELSRRNNELRAAEAEKAAAMLPEFMEEFRIQSLLHDNSDIISRMGTQYKKELYKIRAEKNYSRLKDFLNCLR